MVFLIPFCYAIRLKSYAYSSLLNEIIENKDHLDKIHPPKKNNNEKKDLKISKLESNFRKIYNLFLNTFDDERSVDFIILLFLIETKFNFKLIEFVFYFNIKAFDHCFVSLFVYSNNEWLENKINKIR